MSFGFYLFIDEAGDEGLERVRPMHEDGSSEYFVLCGVLVRASRYAELAQPFAKKDYVLATKGDIVSAD